MEKLSELKLPTVIQGGMGVGISNWRLARAVAETGQLGVVSGTALDRVLLRRLQDGDPGGHMRRALDHFPFPAMAARVWDKYTSPGERRRPRRTPIQRSSRKTCRGRCRTSHRGELRRDLAGARGSLPAVGINYLEKIQPPHLASIYGSMLAGVDYF